MSTAPLNPIVKWVGGKRQLLPAIHSLLPRNMGRTYFEPFLGGGAVLWSLRPVRAVVNDLNPELVNLYAVVRDSPHELLTTVQSYRNEPDFFYELRGLDRNREAFESMSSVERAARMLYLNRTAFNGMYRVNSSGQFNVPFGRYKNLNIDEANLLRISAYLRNAEVSLLNGDYHKAVEGAKEGDFVYFDPPYDPVSETAAFTAYSAGGFTRENQRELFELCVKLDRHGIRFMVSNSRTEFIEGLYDRFNVSIVQARRSVNSVGSKRGAVEEVLVTNYGKEEV